MFRRMKITIKNWILDQTEPWREERASLEEEWRVFAQRHNAAGRRPPFWFPGMEDDVWELDPMEKVVLVDAKETDPNCLLDSFAKMREEQKEMNRKTHGLAHDKNKHLEAQEAEDETDAVL